MSAESDAGPAASALGLALLVEKTWMQRADSDRRRIGALEKELRRNVETKLRYETLLLQLAHSLEIRGLAPDADIEQAVIRAMTLLIAQRADIASLRRKIEFLTGGATDGKGRQGLST